MFERAKAISIVRRMIITAESVVNGAIDAGFLTTNYYSNAECALLALSVIFSHIYTGTTKLGNAIIKEAISGSWRQFPFENYKQDYKNEIESLVSQYTDIIQSVFSRTDINESKKLNIAYCAIAEVFANHFFAEFNEENHMYFLTILVGVKEYICSFTGQSK